MNDIPYYEQLHDEIFEEQAPTMIEALGEGHGRIIQITKTDKGIKFVECCDGYYGTTLTEEQVKRLIDELQKLLAK